MDDNGRWSLFSGLLFLGIGVYLLVKGVGPDWYSYVAVVTVFIAGVAWLARYVVDRRKARSTAEHAEPDTEAGVEGI